MAKIKQLSQHEAQKIAAGEVVERPANIVKELVENSIDAGATRISIYIEDAGKALIRIVDNGCGMDAADAQICFDRHATSKITHVDQLETINTFGFRGEALASIAAVSHITLITKEEQSLEGTCITIDANVISAVSPVACATGTDISIRNLFFNVPARKKFLKTVATEWRAIQLLFNAFCFDYPHIHFSLFSENKQVTNCPTADSVKSRALQLWEPALHQHLIVLQSEAAASYSIDGVISNHQQYRYDKSSIYFFVNKRWVKNYSLTNALIKGYANVIPSGRYPIAAVNIMVPFHEVDINIHPRKEEVKFLHPRRVEQMLQDAVKKALEQNLSQQINRDITFKPAEQPAQSFFAKQERNFTPFNFNAFFEKQNTVDAFRYIPYGNSSDFAILRQAPTSPRLLRTGQDERVEDRQDEQRKEEPEKSATLSIEALPTIYSVSEGGIKEGEVGSAVNGGVSKGDATEYYKLIGQYNKTYILIEKEEGLFLVDQHAAHERILYELFAHRFTEVITIQLLFPQIITVSVQDIALIIPSLDVLFNNGIVVEQCASNQLIVQSLPVYLKDQSIEDLIKEMIGWIIEHKSFGEAELRKTVNNKLQAQMACKAAVKAGDVLTHEKMQQLLIDLEKTANRFSCPHGRPTGWLISLAEIEKKFKRTL